jgi:hypothetical protein
VLIEFPDRQFEHVFPVDFRFPLQWNTGFLTDEFAQASLRDILNRPLRIRKLDAKGMSGEEQIIDQNSQI